MPTLQLLDEVDSWLDVLDQATYYELLGILEIADDTAIQKAFHEFSAHFHPDRYRNEPEQLRQAITKIYQRGAEAYGVLRDPKTRAKYDIALSQGALRYNPGQTSQTPGTDSDVDLAGLARTKGGQFHARQAERALSEGRVEAAKDLLRKALLAEGENGDLARRARKLLELVRSGRIVPPGDS